MPRGAHDSSTHTRPKPQATAALTSGYRNIPTLGRGEPKRDPRVGRFEPPPARPAQPELVPDDAVTVDPQGNVRNAGPFVAVLAELDRRGEP